MEKAYEVCPHCGEEVALDAELKVQTCPNCGKRIVTCSMCRACDTDEPYCNHCCLCYQADVENKEREEFVNMETDIVERVKIGGEYDEDVIRIWLDLDGACNFNGCTDIMCAHLLTVDGRQELTFQVNSPDDKKTIFVSLDEFDIDTARRINEQICCSLTMWKWVAFSNDQSYREESGDVYDIKSDTYCKGFQNKRDCYEDMRARVLSKMTWNTEYDEDFESEEDCIDYKVRFSRNMIIHKSYSGTYVYKIVPVSSKEYKWEDIFTDKLIKELKELNLV